MFVQLNNINTLTINSNCIDFTVVMLMWYIVCSLKDTRLEAFQFIHITVFLLLLRPEGETYLPINSLHYKVLCLKLI